MRLPWRYILVSLVIGLFLGAASGLLAARCLYPSWKKSSFETLLRRYDRDLQLSEMQRSQIHSILKTHREKMRAHRQAVRQDVRTQIRQVLNPEQKARFDAREARREAERQKREGS